jgi:hypothetical protein
MNLSCTVAVNISVCHEDTAGCPLAIGGVVAASGQRRIYVGTSRASASQAY